MSSPITATIDPEKLRAILYDSLHIPHLKSFRVFISAHAHCVESVHSILWVGSEWIVSATWSV